MEVVATTWFTHSVPYSQTGNSFMISSMISSPSALGLTLQTARQCIKTKMKKKKKASQIDWLKSHCVMINFPTVKMLKLLNGFKVMIVFIEYDRLTLLYRFIYRGLWRVTAWLWWLPVPPGSCSAAAGAGCLLKIRALGGTSVRSQHIKLIMWKSSQHLLFQSINLPRPAVMNTVANCSKWMI